MPPQSAPQCGADPARKTFAIPWPGIKRPGVSAVFMFALGIALGRPSAISPLLWFALVCLAFGALIISGKAVRIIFIASLAGGAGLIMIHDTIISGGFEPALHTPIKGARVIADFIRVDSVRIRNTRILLAVRSVNGVPVKGVAQVSARHGSALAKFLPGDRLALSGVSIRAIHGFHNIGGWDYEQYMREKGIDGALKFHSGSTVTKLGSRWTWRRPLEKIKAGFRDSLTSPRTDVSAVMKAMFLGEQGGITPGMRDVFSRAGSAHLLAVSGLHIGFVAAVVYHLARVLLFFIIYPLRYRWASAGVPMRMAALAALAAIWFFCLLTGPRLSSMRATIMISVYLVVLFLGRGRDFYGAFAGAMGIILLLLPWSLFTAGFQLSFTAVFFITVFLERWEPFEHGPGPLEKLAPTFWWRVRRRFPIMAGYAAVSVFATLGAGPIVAFHFNVIPVYGVLLNMAEVPLASVSVPLGILGGLTATGWITDLAGYLSQVILDLSVWAAGLPFSYVTVGSMPSLALLFYYAIIAGLAFSKPGRGRRAFVITTALALIISVSIRPVMERLDNNLTVRFLDVGQADSLVALWPGGGALAIDGGNSFGNFDTGSMIVAPVLWRAQRTRLNAIFATHGDSDHIGGLRGLAERVPPSMLYGHGRKTIHPMFISLRQWARRRGIYRSLRRGDRLKWPGGLTVSALNPPDGALAYPAVPNNLSLVLKLSYGSVSLLSVGDISAEVEQWLVESGAPLKADVLKIAHHGSGASSSAQFLKAVGARYAVISVGYMNRHGHPHPSALRRIRDAGMKIFRTDRDGEIVMTTDGHNIHFTTFRDKKIMN